ncbi:MAG: DEAD/DEAH box helicase [Corynebacterium sp.]|nr:DEAD/DEAH box helicase [Corynebacterium sp.]
MPAQLSSQRPLPTFAELGVAGEIVTALAERGVTRTFAIQELTLPIALEGRDLIGQARTGMGKTFGFGVPLLDRIFDDADIDELDGTPRALVVVPTRELCIQVGGDLDDLARHLPIHVTTIYGGTSYEDQEQALLAGTDVVVGTPGRLLDLYQKGTLPLDQVRVLVLDEADEMLDLGFLPAIEKILAAVTAPHQTMLFSATMPDDILRLARGFMTSPVHIRAEMSHEAEVNEQTSQVVFKSHRMDKEAVTARIMQARGRGKTIIFVRTKRSAADVATHLASAGFKVASVHGNLNQQARERSLDAFRHGTVDILVATDVAARGLDIDDVTHVINYQTPDDELTYVHRIGRTGRAGHSGVAVTLVGYDEVDKWKLIDSGLGLDYGELPEWFSNSPELYDALDIPTDATGVVGPSLPVFGQARGDRSRRPAPRGRSRRGRK